MSSQPSATVSSIYEPQIATILSGQTESSAIDVYGATAVGFTVPADVGSSLTFLVSDDSVNFTPYTDPDLGQPVEALLSGTGVQAFSFVPAKFFGWRSLKIVADAPVDGDKVFRVTPKAI